MAAVVAAGLVYLAAGAGREAAGARPPEESLHRIIPGRYIVTLDENADAGVAAGALAGSYDFTVARTYESAIQGFSAWLSDDEVAQLRDDPRVRSVEPDRLVRLPAETLPTGLARTQAGPAGDINGSTPDRDIDVAVIDSGIALNNPELRVAGGMASYGEAFFIWLFCGFTDSYDDAHGHGTHVSGTIAARDNADGVIGLAPGARLWAVRVIGAGGVGCLSDVIAGVDWVTANAATIEVANMSLGGFGDSPALCTAISNSVAAGIVYAVAAGNEGQDATNLSPANCTDAIAVSAIADYNGQPGGGAATTCENYGPDDTVATFSNYGAVVDIAAPGVCILSTYVGGLFVEASGTSMASPHVAGAVARFLLDTGYSGSPSGPAVVSAMLTGGYAVPQNSPCGFTGDPDGSPEPMLFIGTCGGGPPPTRTPTSTIGPSPTSTITPTPTDTPTATNTPTATPTPSPASALSVSAGGFHTCALTSTGGVRCWGDNASGQIGDGSTTARTRPTEVFGLTSGIAAVSAGGSHTCALTTGGGVLCWGSNAFGQLGDGTTTSSGLPVSVSGLSSGVSQISAGGYHTCALLTGGGITCWGKNNRGQLGNGTTSNSSVPVDVTGLDGPMAYVGAGGSDAQGGHTCAVGASGGAKCWGRNDFGQLGDGTTFDRLMPADVSGLSSGVATIGGGRYHTCALTTGGGAKCWGWNIFGQLGDGSTTRRSTPVDVSGLSSGLSVVTAGGVHSCALLTNTSSRCWGSNTSGQLGEGLSGNSRSSPVPVIEIPDVAWLMGATGYSAGGSIASDGHTCAVLSGAVKCWGLNNAGQVGDGTFSNRTLPVSVIDFVALPSGPTATPTPTQTPTAVPTATDTPVPPPTATNTPTATETPVPTATDTPVPPPTATNTPLPSPTATNTPTPVPTATETPTPTGTSTPVPPPTATSTPTPTETPMPTATDTPTATATDTPVPPPTATSAPTATDTPTPTPTDTPTPTPVPATATETPTATPTDTPTPTPVPPNATATPTATDTPVPPPTATSTPTATDTPTPTATDTATPTPVPATVLYFSLNADGTVGGVSTANEDIVAWNGSTFSVHFDGSDVGLASFNIDAFSIVNSNEILLSFAAAGTVPGIAGTVDDSDVVRFTATSLGGTTAGSFEMYFDGSDVGLTTTGENVDAVELLPDGSLLFSTTGNLSAGGVGAADEDLVRFVPASLGTTTAGGWSLYFHGSDVGLATNGSEDLDAAAVDAAGRLHLSTVGAFSVPGVSGADEDVFIFTPASLGATTTGTYSPTLFFDGSAFGLGSNDVNAIDLP